MRKVVLAMMTTLNGRLDDPDAWVTGISADQYQQIARNYSTFDTVLVGKVTYQEMYEFWPTAGDADDAGESQRAMAEMMNTYQKYVFTTGPKQTLEWNNADQIIVASDDEISGFVHDLKGRPGKDIHLSGGATLAQTMIRLGLVDEYRFFVYPVVSPGASWFDALDDGVSMELVGASSFDSGVVELHYRAVSAG